MRDDEMLARDDRWAVRLERHLAHPVETVWAAVTEPSQLAQWFPTTVELELVVGGAVRFGDPQADPGGTVLELDPPRLLAFSWEGDELRFELEPEGGGTRLVLLHTFDDRAGGASFGAGWQQCLAALEPALDGGPLPPTSRTVAEHEQLVGRFGLDRPEVTATADGWSVRFERQLTCPAEVAWDRFLGARAEEPAQPEVGRPLRAPAGDVVLGTVTEAERPCLLAFDTAPGEPGEHVRLELGEGTGHGARLVLTLRGSDPVERDAAADRWGRGVEHVAAQGAEWALART